MKRIKFLSKFFGKIRSGDWNLEKTDYIIHSDTLFSAICNNFSLLYGKSELELLIEKWQKDKSPLFSSLFPLIRISFTNEELKTSKEVDLYFYPKPMLKIKPEDEIIFEEHPKDWKNIKFVSESVFLSIVAGEPISVNKEFILSDLFLISTRERELILQLSSRALGLLSEFDPYFDLDEDHVTIDRITHQSMPFFVTFLNFNYREFVLNDNSIIKIRTGLHCLWQGDLSEKTTAALRLIADEGLGGKRTVGSGLFEKIEVVEASLDRFFKETAKAYIILSLMYPTESDFPQLKAYSFVNRGGFVYSPTNRTKPAKMIRMVREGSIANSEITGNLLDVTPDNFNKHQVYKYGLAFSLPVSKVIE
ncbi:MAG: type III-A CRISPR-associated RAMP protein Csm4 [Candidatus Hodarchaeota archaeon]